MGRGRSVSDTTSLRWVYEGRSIENFHKSSIRVRRGG